MTNQTTNLISAAQFAEITGVSRTMISKKTKSGELIREGRLYDLANPRNHSYLVKRQTKSQGKNITLPEPPKPQPVQKVQPIKKPPVQKKPPIKPTQAPQKNKGGRPKQRANITPIATPEQMEGLWQATEDEAEAKARKAIADADLAEYKARNEEIKLDSLERRIIRTDEAEFLYFGFLDKLAQEALRASKTMITRLEHAITDNPDPAEGARQITIILRNEIEAIIRQSKKDQKEAMQEYYESKKK